MPITYDPPSGVNSLDGNGDDLTINLDNENGSTGSNAMGSVAGSVLALNFDTNDDTVTDDVLNIEDFGTVLFDADPNAVRLRSVVLQFIAAALPVLLLAGSPLGASAQSSIELENLNPGTDPSDWYVAGPGDANIQGFGTDISVNVGGTIDFKIDTDASSYDIDIYRLGYYQGNGARNVGAGVITATLPQAQPACLYDSVTGMTDCGNWGVSAHWDVPTDAVSGVYIAKLTRTDATPGTSRITFIVRNDASTSDLFFQTSDATWQAYNLYGGKSTYPAGGGPPGFNHATKASYNRPFDIRHSDGSPGDDVFAAEYPMLRWLEANGYDVTYTSSVDTDRRGSLIQQHKVFLSVGHDEYWSGPQRANVTAARDAGVHLAFFSGNEVYWKTRYEPSSDGSNTPYRTLVVYKEGTLGENGCGSKCDPELAWTGLWRDGCAPTYSPATNGACLPENALTGQISWDGSIGRIEIPHAFKDLRFWRNTSIASLAPGQTATLSEESLGSEWDWENTTYAASYPARRILLSTTVLNSRTHHLSLYRADSGALVFASGTIQWSWGLDSFHTFNQVDTNVDMQQATVNLFADMGAAPTSLQPGLIPATGSSDMQTPASVITAPANGATTSLDSTLNIEGTAADVGGGVVAGVEVSVDGGTTWRAATGTTAWSYAWSPTAEGSVTIKSRAFDDTGNLETPAAGVTITVTAPACPCTVFGGEAPTATLANDHQPTVGIEFGMKFRADDDGVITALRYYKPAGATGLHTGNLWTSTGTNLARQDFANETASGWQEVTLTTPVPITAGTTYIVSYFSASGDYLGVNNYFAQQAGLGRVHGLADGTDGPNGLYEYTATTALPTNSYLKSNYYADVVFDTTTALCGDGVRQGGEECDDGGVAPGDGCSEICSYEGPDADGDGILNIYETGTGVYVSPSNTGTDPLDADSDDDGSSDGDELSAGTDPNDAQSFPDVTAPLISSVVAVVQSDGLSAQTSWTTNEAARSLVSYGTDPQDLSLQVSSPALVTSHQLLLGSLQPATLYYYRVSSADAANNSATSPAPPEPPASFATPAQACAQDDVVSDFAQGSGTGTEVTAIDDGELSLAAEASSRFDDSSLPAGWSATPWSPGGSAEVAGGSLSVNGSLASGIDLIPAGRVLEFRATFGTEMFEHVGFSIDLNGAPYAIFSTFNTTTTLFARTGDAGQVDQPLPGVTLGVPHLFRIEWTAASVLYYVDGALVASHPGIAADMRPVVSDFAPGGPSLAVDWLRMSDFAPTGSFDSAIFDAGTRSGWEAVSWSAMKPATTGVALSVRAGDTPVPGPSWSAFAPIPAPGDLAQVAGRYAQYRAQLSSGDPKVAPLLQDVTLRCEPTSAICGNAVLESFEECDDGGTVSGDGCSAACSYEGPDADGDGIANEAETNTGVFVSAADTGTDPLDADSDDDGLLDGFEVTNGFDPLVGGNGTQDPDGDGLNNLGEQTAGTNPNDSDSDDDGVDDAAEVAAGTSPLDPGRYPVVFDFVRLLDPGNAADVTGFGAVEDSVGTAKREVTIRQYVSFLNAVADTDVFALYDAIPGILRSGSSGSYVYSAVAGQEDRPVNFVSFYDAMRFVNWMENDQPDGPQDATTTEDGAYTITGAGIAANSITRNSEAHFALPTEDEWYKAAYYDPSSSSYFDYPASSDTPTLCAAPGADANTANCDEVVNDLTDVGSYTGSASPNGTFDQGGNVWEWTESVSGADRRIRGGGFASPASDLAAANSGLDADPLVEDPDVGFRLPEPDGLWPLGVGIAALLALSRRRGSSSAAGFDSGTRARVMGSSDGRT